MICKYLLVQIHSSEWVLFNVFNILKKSFISYSPFSWMGFKCLKAIEPLRGGTLFFTTKLPSILSFLKKLLPTIFQYYVLIANSDVMFCAIWYHLYNLKNVKNTHRGVLLLIKMQASSNFTKSNTPPRMFFTFFKLYKWYQIAQNISI